MSDNTTETHATVGFRKDLLIFWLRMVGWLITGVAVPITVFSINFGLFTEYGYQITTDELGNVTSMNIALNGWGIISAVLIGFTAISICNEVIDAYSSKYSLTKQILVGITSKLIPLLIGIVVCVFLKGCLDQIIFCLSTIAISQLAAIPLNPLPKWKAEKKDEEDYSDLITGLRKLLKLLKSKKGEK
jgi:hypothetical protein